MQYQPIARAHSVLCDGGVPDGLVYPLVMQPVYPYSTQMEWMVQTGALTNNSGSTAIVGMGVRKARHIWLAGSWTDATTTYTDDTGDAQSSGASDFALETTTANDGFVVLCREKFNLLCIKGGTAGVGAGTVHDIAYSSGAGTWTTFTPANMIVAIPNTAGQNWATGEQIAWWDDFVDWGLTTGAEGTGVPNNYYAIRIRATTAPGTAALATSMSVHHVSYYAQGVTTATRQSLINPGVDCGSSLGYGEACTAVFSVANAKNRVEAEIRSRG